jgi:hypothetical protein
LQSEDISKSFITAEGFSILTSQMISGAFTVVLAVFMRGTPFGKGGTKALHHSSDFKRAQLH